MKILSHFSTHNAPATLRLSSDKEDGSLERYERHGWGDVSLLKPNSTRPTIYDKPPKLRCPFHIAHMTVTLNL